MWNESLYHKTVSILAKSYFENTLYSQDCTACAVGNLIAANNNYQRVCVAGESLWMDKSGNYFRPSWIHVFGTPKKTIFGFRIGAKKQYLNISKYTILSKNEVESTGYRLDQLAKIENAFESRFKGNDKMFNALMSVVSCLDEIHENNDSFVTIKTKKIFQKHQCEVGDLV